MRQGASNNNFRIKHGFRIMRFAQTPSQHLFPPFGEIDQIDQIDHDLDQIDQIDHDLDQIDHDLDQIDQIDQIDKIDHDLDHLDLNLPGYEMLCRICTAQTQRRKHVQGTCSLPIRLHPAT